ncbi:hypothetical protein J2W47_004993 [Priestia megaterium]|nr:hypothetical protein [Priestia megaterium]
MRNNTSGNLGVQLFLNQVLPKYTKIQLLEKLY